jgi:pilus assembly protein Flp/PilA
MAGQSGGMVYEDCGARPACPTPAVLACRPILRVVGLGMSPLLQKVKRFLLAEDGPTAVEYAMLLMLIILICLTGITMFGQATSASFERSQNLIRQATQSHP